MKAHVLDAIQNAKVEEGPWRHYYVKSIFPEDFYQQLLSNLPDPSLMSPIRGSIPTCRSYRLENKGDRPHVLLFWDRLREDLFDYLWVAFEDKLGVEGNSIGSEVVNDLPGYRSGPHTGTPDKLVTALFYLPLTNEDTGQGTVLYQGEKPDPQGKGHCFGGDFTPHKVIPYTPNSVLFFQRTDKSYHGVLPTLAERWSLVFNVFW